MKWNTMIYQFTNKKIIFLFIFLYAPKQTPSNALFIRVLRYLAKKYYIKNFISKVVFLDLPIYKYIIPIKSHEVEYKGI